jgi:hypothetical protein
MTFLTSAGQLVVVKQHTNNLSLTNWPILVDIFKYSSEWLETLPYIHWSMSERAEMGKAQFHWEVAKLSNHFPDLIDMGKIILK